MLALLLVPSSWERLLMISFNIVYHIWYRQMMMLLVPAAGDRVPLISKTARPDQSKRILNNFSHRQ